MTLTRHCKIIRVPWLCVSSGCSPSSLCTRSQAQCKHAKLRRCRARLRCAERAAFKGTVMPHCDNRLVLRPDRPSPACRTIHGIIHGIIHSSLSFLNRFDDRLDDCILLSGPTVHPLGERVSHNSTILRGQCEQHWALSPCPKRAQRTNWG